MCVVGAQKGFLLVLTVKKIHIQKDYVMGKSGSIWVIAGFWNQIISEGSIRHLLIRV